MVDAMEVAAATLSELIDRVDSGTRLGNEIHEESLKSEPDVTPATNVQSNHPHLDVSGLLETLEKETPCMFSTISSLLLVEK